MGFDRQKQSAKRMIEKNGQKVTWRIINNPETETGKPWRTLAFKPEDKQVKIVFIPANRENFQTYCPMKSAAEVIKISVIGLLAASSVTFKPNNKDIVLRGETTLKISFIDELAPDGEPILYTIGFE
jgi:hypothetical protein